jgi:hypothetical protein
MQHVMVVVPVDADIDEAQRIARELWNMAMTPSLKASMRLVFMLQYRQFFR